MNAETIPNLKISSEYLQRENLRGYYVLDWIKDYTKKNKIIFDTEEGYVLLRFKSEKQKDCFVRRGNNKFPYFEFW